jgi:hypothetical protein
MDQAEETNVLLEANGSKHVIERKLPRIEVIGRGAIKKALNGFSVSSGQAVDLPRRFDDRWDGSIPRFSEMSPAGGTRDPGRRVASSDEEIENFSIVAGGEGKLYNKASYIRELVV